MIKRNFKRLLAILLALAPIAFAAACSKPDNSTSSGGDSEIVEEQPKDPSEEVPPEEEPSEEEPSEEEPTKPTLPGGLVDGGNFTGRV